MGIDGVSERCKKSTVNWPQGVHGLEEVECFLGEVDRVKMVIGKAHEVDLRFPCTR